MFSMLMLMQVCFKLRLKIFLFIKLTAVHVYSILNVSSFLLPHGSMGLCEGLKV